MDRHEARPKPWSWCDNRNLLSDFSLFLARAPNSLEKRTGLQVLDVFGLLSRRSLVGLPVFHFIDSSLSVEDAARTSVYKLRLDEDSLQKLVGERDGDPHFVRCRIARRFYTCFLAQRQLLSGSEIAA